MTKFSAHFLQIAVIVGSLLQFHPLQNAWSPSPLPRRAKVLWLIAMLGLVAVLATPGLSATSQSDTGTASQQLLERGNALADADQFQQAIERFRQARQEAVACGDTSVEIDARLNEARASLDMNRSPEAAAMLAAIAREKLPTLASTERALAMGEMLHRVDRALGSSQRTSEAVDWLQSALRQAAMAGDVRSESLAIGLLGGIAESQREWQTTLANSRIAARLAEQVGALDLLYRWHWQSARALEALGDSKQALVAYTLALDTLEPIRPMLAKRSSSFFRRQIAPLFFDTASAMLKQLDELPRQQQTSVLMQVQQTVERLRAAEVRDYFDDECVLAEERAVEIADLGSDIAVIYPILFDDRLEVLISLSDTVLRHTSRVSRGELRRRVMEFRRALTSDASDAHKKPARLLYSWLLGPAVTALERAQVSTLVFVPDGALRTIPVAALWNGDRYLIEDFAVSTSLGVSLTDPEPLRARNLGVLASGLSVAAGGLEALPSVETELAQINKLLDSRTLLNDEFRVEPVLNELSEGPYSVVHIATHGKFAADFRDSFLQAYDGRISLNQVEQSVSRRRLDGEPIELLVLSACETALGDDRAALGLAGVALKAGARSAVATLWSVSDAATAELIGEFYRQLSLPGTSKAQALRTAQRLLLEDDEFAHPRLWSPYLILGNWL
ncbi:MAG: CHAT domain-containing protein [Pseudomonadota bacterium]